MLEYHIFSEEETLLCENNFHDKIAIYVNRSIYDGTCCQEEIVAWARIVAFHFNEQMLNGSTQTTFRLAVIITLLLEYYNIDYYVHMSDGCRMSIREK